MIDGLHGQTTIQLIVSGDKYPKLICIDAWYKDWEKRHTGSDYKPYKVLDRGIWKDAIPIKYHVEFREPMYTVKFDVENYNGVFGQFVCTSAKTFRSLKDDITFDLRNKAAATVFEIPVNLTIFKMQYTKCKITNIVECEKPLTAPDAVYSVKLIQDDPNGMYTLGNGIMIPCVTEGAK